MQKQKPKTETVNGRPLYRKSDFAVLGILLVAAIAGFILWSVYRTSGAVARVTVLTNGVHTEQLVPLSEDATLHIDGAALPVTLEVREGRIRFVHTVCPDHLCENTGWISHEGESAICLPAGVWVEVVEE